MSAVRLGVVSRPSGTGVLLRSGRGRHLTTHGYCASDSYIKGVFSAALGDMNFADSRPAAATLVP